MDAGGGSRGCCRHQSKNKVVVGAHPELKDLKITTQAHMCECLDQVATAAECDRPGSRMLPVPIQSCFGAASDSQLRLNMGRASTAA
mmetsp:Transcript_7409/g.12782  ORF Transcript_7409/g.12782 Transcript_7409/m.12782 type:complete len:87 (-) Transcript_7409:566-826(-)